MKKKVELTGDQIVQICTDLEVKPYCNPEYCIRYSECTKEIPLTGFCERAIGTYLDSEDTETERILYELEDIQSWALNLDNMSDPRASVPYDVLTDTIRLIKCYQRIYGNIQSTQIKTQSK